MHIFLFFYSAFWLWLPFHAHADAMSMAQYNNADQSIHILIRYNQFLSFLFIS